MADAALTAAAFAAPPQGSRLRLADLGQLTAVGRPGGQGRVYRPGTPPPGTPLVVKLYHRAPPAAAVAALSEMIAWRHGLAPADRARLDGLTAWPRAVVTAARDAPGARDTPGPRDAPGAGDAAAGIAMPDFTARFTVPFVLPSGRLHPVLLSLEHLLGDDSYLLSRGLDVGLGTVMRLRVAQRISSAMAFLHDHGIVVSDVAPNNLLVSFGRRGPPIAFIDCDSMVFRGRQALPAVQTIDWQLPGDWHEGSDTRAADAYKLGLIVLRLLARSHDARAPAAYRRHLPAALREPLARALAPHPAGRPTPAEWARLLRMVSLAPGIGAAYPGPARSRPRTAPVAAVAPVTGSAFGSLAVPAAGARAAYRPRRGARRTAPAALAIAWVVIGTVLLTIVLARLFADAIPTAGPSQLGQGRGPVYVVPDDGPGGQQFP